MIKRILLILLVIILGVAGYVWYQFSHNKGGGFKGEQATKLEIKSATPQFDEGIKTMMVTYFTLKDAFVNADTAAVMAAGIAIIKDIDSIKLDELKKDTSGLITTIQPLMSDVQANAVSLVAQHNITEMRKDFDGLNQQLFSLLKSINYKGEKIYWQVCPMAFDGDKPAYWLDIKSGTGRTNPYLGKKDPTYGSAMLNCGEDKDSIMVK